MEKIKASDCKCIRCGEEADCFWPVVDVDIQALSYCNSCVMSEKIKVLKAADEFLNEKDEE